MRLVINGIAIIGVEYEVLSAIVNAKCGRCLHSSFGHKEEGCKIEDCECKHGFNTYLLLQEDQDFINDIIREGLL